MLIDDIFTTGTTANECARILKLAGADKVYVMCVCETREKNYITDFHIKDIGLSAENNIKRKDNFERNNIYNSNK